MNWRCNLSDIICMSALALVLLACSSKKPQQPGTDDPPELRLEPLPNEQAELVALWLSQEIEAPLALYERVSHDLAEIDEIAPFLEEVGSFPAVMSPVPSKVSLDFHLGGIEQVQSGLSPIWDSLNELYQPTIEWGPDPGRARLHFPGRLNSKFLVQDYREVPEVSSAGQYGSFYEVGKWRRELVTGSGQDDSIMYVFSGGSGPTNDRTTEDTLFCFIGSGAGVGYAGTYIPQYEDRPEWFSVFCSPLTHTTAGNWCFGSHKNLIVNASFEVGAEPTFAGWGSSLPELTNVIQTPTRAGSYALMLSSVWFPPSRSYVTTQVTGLSSGDIVRLGAYARTLVPSDGCSLSLLTGVSLDAPSTTTSVAATNVIWTYISIVDTLSLGDGDSVWVRLYSPNSDTQTKWGMFDLVGLVKLGHVGE